MKKGNQVHDKNYKICGAKTKRGTPCKRPAGWGTNHVGEGRCKLHGGASTGPKNQKGNKNALTTGEYESIIYDVLGEEEKALYHQINLDRLAQTNNEIKLTEIRLRRMMLRIKELQDKDYIITNHKKGIEKDAKVDVAEAENALLQIQNIEEAITRVQGHKARLIDLKHKLEQDLGINKELQKARIDKTKADINRITGVHAEVEYLGNIYNEVYGDNDEDN